MRARFAHTLVSLTLAVAILHPFRVAAQGPEPIEDREAYAIYAVVLDAASKETMLLQRETIEPYQGCGSLADADPDWEAVENSLRQENIRVKQLQPMLPVNLPYRLISRAEIEADDARLALKYPELMQRLMGRHPESIKYAAVSAVGFNPSKTRAMVWVMDLRGVSVLRALEVLGGEWRSATLARGCVGPIA
jgi:hypothetical protein